MWEFKDGRPIYIQIIEQIKLRIISGEYPAGGKLLSVRELAAEASVNPNTMQRALSELERDGLIYSQRTMGRFITEDQASIDALRQSFAMEQAIMFVEKMRSVGYAKNEIISLIQSLENRDPDGREKEALQ